MRKTGGRESRGQVNEWHRGSQMQQVAFSAVPVITATQGNPTHASTEHLFYTLTNCNKETSDKSNLSNLLVCVLSDVCFQFLSCHSG